MKKILTSIKPIFIISLSFLIVSFFLRYYLHASTNQLIREFKNQNYRELYALDTLKISSRLNSLSTVINWTCIEGTHGLELFYSLKKGECASGFFQERQVLSIPEANNLKIAFTVKLPNQIEYLFIVFLTMQIILVFSIMYVTRKIEEEKRLHETKIMKIARQTFHDIRSPLATLNALSESIKDISSQDKILMEKSIDRINSIALGLLNISKKEQFSQISHKIEKHSLNDLLKEVINFKEIEFKELPNVSIHYNFPLENISSIYNEIDLKNIISNLINNSIESKANQLAISLEGTNQNAIIKIEDNGQGIPSHILERIGSEEFTTKKSGNGLGLLHAYESIHQWNGKIEIKSTMNKGTTVKIFLPIILENKQSVLIDDDDLVRLTWESVAKKRNINFVSLSSTEQFNKISATLNLDSPIYIDSNLGDETLGEEFANQLHIRGFTNIYITSGHEKERFINLIFLKGIRDKSPPW